MLLEYRNQNCFNKLHQILIEGFIEVHREAYDNKIIHLLGKMLHNRASLHTALIWKISLLLTQATQEGYCPKLKLDTTKHRSFPQEPCMIQKVWPSTHSENEVLRQTGIKSPFTTTEFSHAFYKVHQNGSNKSSRIIRHSRKEVSKKTYFS